MSDIPTWLYSENAAFWTDKTGSPANYDEIIENLRARYGVSDLPFRWRMVLAIVAFVITMMLVLTLSLLILSTLDNIFDRTLTVIDFFIGLIIVPSEMVGAYIFLSVTFDLIAHRQRAVEKSWSDLLSKGILLEGKVVSIERQKWGERKLKYEFFDSDGKRRTGFYFLFQTGPSIGISDKVAVWYVHRKFHTLL